MGFDKSKVMRAAEKSLAQGKIPAAIREYQQIVEHDPDDFSALNMLGDLLIRVGEEESAVACFTRVAEHYREEGFALKAIAMYKKMDRLKPGLIEIAAKLAPLYEMQGLIIDARTQYLLIADSYTRSGNVGKALEILRKIADLDPNNTDIRLKLAEGYARENFRSDAAEAYCYAGAQFYGRGAYEQALDAYMQGVNLIPFDHAALSGLTSAHIALGTADEIVERLASASEAMSDDAEILSLLTYAYVAAEDADAAERATANLVQREPTSFKRFVEVIRLYLKKGDLASAVRLLANNTEQMLAGNEDATVSELINEVLARDPEQMEALGLLVRLHTWQHDSERLRVALERMAEAAEAAGLADAERHALTQLVRLAPDEQRYRDRLLELGGVIEEPDGFEVLTDDGEPEDVPTFESFVSMSEDAVVSSADDVPQFEWQAEPSSTADPASSFADLNDGTAERQQVKSPATPAFHEIDFNESFESSNAGMVEMPLSTQADSSDRRDAALRQELESVDFYMAQGYADIASDTLEMLERQYGHHPEIETRRAKLHASSPATVSTPAVPAESFEFHDSQVKEPQVQPQSQSQVAPEPVAPVTSPAREIPEEPTGPIIDPGLAAIFDEFRNAVEEDDTPLDGDYETHFNLGLAYKDMDLLDEAVEEFQTAASLAPPRDGTPRYLQCCNLLGHCFVQKGMGRVAVMWFNRGLQAPGHTEDEYQALRYELGAAYEQMGELDKAIDVFSEVYGVNVSYRGVADRLRDLQSQKQPTK